MQYLASGIEVEARQEDTSFHDEPEFHKAVRNFHDRFAIIPLEIEAAKPGHEKRICSLLEYFRGQNIKVYSEFVGSSYEGVKVAKSKDNDDLEFDVMIIMKLPDSWKIESKNVPGKPGYSFLKVTSMPPRPTGQKKSFFDEMENNGFLDGSTAVNVFFGELQKWLNDFSDLHNRILLRRHGPAVQMDVMKNNKSSERPYYSVDVVLTFRHSENGSDKYYVVKPFKSKTLPDTITWRPVTSEYKQFSLRVSDQRVDEYSPTYLSFMMKIEEYLNSVSQKYKLQFLGHKANELNDDSVEFKVLLINTDQARQLYPHHIPDKPGYHRLLSDPDGQRTGALDSKKVTTELVNNIQRCIEQSGLMNGKIQIRREGSYVNLLVTELIPNTQIQLQSRKKKGPTPLFYIDLLYAFKTSDGNAYIARPIETEEERSSLLKEMSKAWRRSYAIDARDMLLHSPECLKMTCRMLKVIRNLEKNSVASLTSYHIKTTILQMIAERRISEVDCTEKIGKLLVEALERLKISIRNKVIDDYFIPGLNHLADFSDDCLRNMENRIHSLLTSRKEMYSLLNQQSSRCVVESSMTQYFMH